MDRAYLGMQVVLKSLGHVVPYEHVPEEEVDGIRYAFWERSVRPPLPALRVPLPPNAVLSYTFNSILSRGAVWVTELTPRELRTFLAEVLGEDWTPPQPSRGGFERRNEEVGADVIVFETRGVARLAVKQRLGLRDRDYLHASRIEIGVQAGSDKALPKP